MKYLMEDSDSNNCNHNVPSQNILLIPVNRLSFFLTRTRLLNALTKIRDSSCGRLYAGLVVLLVRHSRRKSLDRHMSILRPGRVVTYRDLC